MNNMLKSLLVTALAISASHVSAYTNQNYLSVPRAQSASLLADSHLTRDLVATKGQDRFGGNFLVSGYYSESLNKNDLGKFFGVAEKSTFKGSAGDDATSDFRLGRIIRAHASEGAAVGAVTGRSVNITFQPKTVSYGVEFAYVQCLGKILDGLHLAVSLPVERVENNINLAVANVVGADAAANVVSFLKGTLANTTNNAIHLLGANTGVNAYQVGLKNGLIDGKQGATGIADIKALLGYDFIRNEDWTAGLNIGFTVPTGNTPTGKYLFEPLYGNGGHWELGFGGRVEGRLWSDGDQRIGMNLSADYRYGFQANETRILGAGDTDPFGRYMLIGVVGQAVSTAAPVANTFTIPVSVTPNSSVRGNLGLSYGNGGFVFGLAYAPSWKQAESTSVNPTIAAGTSELARAQDYANAPAAPFVAAGGLNLGTPITRASFDLSKSTRPSQVGHRLGGNLGYAFRNYEFPITIGAGGHYELAGSNAVAENWGVNVTAGIGF